MTRRRGTASLVASPVLVGAVTVLISIIAVFIAYNANAGLPFVPTYDLTAEIPTGGKLVKGNEVRTGGFRVGVVEEITPKVVEEDGKRRAIAQLDLKLDKTVEPLPVDTSFYVRPRSALGLKYVELTPGKSKRILAPGDTVPISRAPKEALELEEIYTIFDDRTRDSVRAATEGAGDAFAGRGVALNSAIESLNPFFRSLVPVMQNLSHPDTDLDNFFRQLGGAAAQAAPVARTQAVLFTNMADTFEAISRDPRALQATIEKSPPTMDVAISSFRVQRPFLADFADLSRRLRPAVQELPRSLPALNRAFRVGQPILPRSVAFNRRFEGVLRQLEKLFDNPNTLLAIRDLRTALSVARPAVEFIAPYQTVCNYFNYFFHPLGEHQSQVAANLGGTVQNQGGKADNPFQANRIGSSENSRPWDIPTNVDPRGAQDPPGEELGRLYAIPYMPAIDAQGNADCQNGQTGWVKGPYNTVPIRYPRGQLSDGTPGGANWAVTGSNFPILSGGTDKSRELGIDNLADVP